MWRLLLGTMGVKSLVQGLNAAATAGFEPRTVWSEVRRRNRLATAPPWASWASSPVKLQEQGKRSRIRVLEDDKISAATNWVSIWEWNLKLVFLIFPWGSWMGLVRITSWYPNFNGSHFWPFCCVPLELKTVSEPSLGTAHEPPYFYGDK